MQDKPKHCCACLACMTRSCTTQLHAAVVQSTVRLLKLSKSALSLMYWSLLICSAVVAVACAAAYVASVAAVCIEISLTRSPRKLSCITCQEDVETASMHLMHFCGSGTTWGCPLHGVKVAADEYNCKCKHGCAQAMITVIDQASLLQCAFEQC